MSPLSSLGLLREKLGQSFLSSFIGCQGLGALTMGSDPGFQAEPHWPVAWQERVLLYLAQRISEGPAGMPAPQDCGPSGGWESGTGTVGTVVVVNECE